MAPEISFLYDYFKLVDTSIQNISNENIDELELRKNLFELNESINLSDGAFRIFFNDFIKFSEENLEENEIEMDKVMFSIKKSLKELKFAEKYNIPSREFITTNFEISNLEHTLLSNEKEFYIDLNTLNGFEKHDLLYQINKLISITLYIIDFYFFKINYILNEISSRVFNYISKNQINDDLKSQTKNITFNFQKEAPKIKKDKSFGVLRKNVDYIQKITDSIKTASLHLDIFESKEDEIQFGTILFSHDLSEVSTQVKFKIKTVQVRMLFNSIQKYFKPGLRAKVGRSKLFISNEGNTLTANNIANSGSDDLKYINQLESYFKKIENIH